MSNKARMVSAKEIHKRAEDALRNDTLFEYECICEGELCVWNPYLEYAILVSSEEAIEKERSSPDTFYPIAFRDDEDGDECVFSDIYDYYFNEKDGHYYAVCLRRRCQ